jgi:CoA:oxalate CoA-transferase
VDVAMLDSMVSILENAIIRYQVTQQVPGPIGSRHPSITPFGCFQARDGIVVIAAGHDKHFELLCDLIGRPELKEDDRFSTNGLRTRNVRDLTHEINDALSCDTVEAWINKFDRAGIVCGKINTVKDLFQSKQIRARNMLVPLEGEEPFFIAGNPIKYGDIFDALTAGNPPALGEHSEEILRTVLGYSPDEIDELCKEAGLPRQEESSL